MQISLRWLNDYLDPGDLTAEEADRLLTDAGFPIESETTLDSGDVLLDVEVTSNRGDCLSHVGVAREIAASPRASRARRLLVPVGGRDGHEPPRMGGDVRDHLRLSNETPELCPRFTAQLIRGVKVGPSPDWLVQRLEAVGQRSINNVVDITNWLNFELGHPSHVFDLAKLAGGALVVRHAREGEGLLTLDGVKRTLSARDLVVADAERATSLAGVIGGGESEVSDDTVDIVLEVATWDPRTVRDQARRHKVRTDASHRFERIVDARMLEWAARRGAALLLEVAGGELCEGVLIEGPDPAPAREIELRPERCRQILGADISEETMAAYLNALEVEVVTREAPRGVMTCRAPFFRPDLTREIDLIEEIARTHGYGAIPIAERLPMIAAHPQEDERAVREIAGVLTGLGYFETVTFSFVRPEEGDRWRDASLLGLSVDDERRGAEPTLRPSVVPSLLRCRKANQDGRVERAGGVRLFEISAVFAESAKGASREHRALTLLADVAGEGVKRSFEDRQLGMRRVVGAIEAVTRAVAGPRSCLVVEPASPTAPGWDADAHAEVILDAGGGAVRLGRVGLVSPGALKSAGVDVPVVAAEIDLDPLIALFPPAGGVTAPPAFPAIDRDLSLIVDESVSWRAVAGVIGRARDELMEGFVFVGAYRGKQVGEGKKSVTARVRFRAADRTLRHEEVDPQIEAVVGLARSELGADLRA